MLAQYAKSKGYKIGTYSKSQYLEAVMRKYGFRDWDSVLAAIGHGGLKEGQVFNKLMEAYEKSMPKRSRIRMILDAATDAHEKLHLVKSKGGIVVRGIHDVAVRFQNAAVPFPATRLWDLLQEDGESPFTVPTV